MTAALATAPARTAVIRFACDHCDYTIKLASHLAGRRGKCPSCREVVQVPGQKQETAVQREVERRIEEYQEEKGDRAETIRIVMCSLLACGVFLRILLVMLRTSA